MGVTKWGSARILRSFLFSVKQIFPRKIFDETPDLQDLRAEFAVNHPNANFHLRPDVRRRKDRCDFDLISDVLPFDRLWYGEPDAISRSLSAFAG